MASLHFEAEMKILGINPYIPISREQAAQLQPDWRKPMPVLVQINGRPKDPWHINMMPAGDGNYYLYLHEIVRTASHTKVGDTVQVSVQFDKDYQSGPAHDMPAGLAGFLAQNDVANRRWKALPPSRQKEVLRYLAGLKSAEARERNLAKVKQALTEDGTRFMARTWHQGN